MKLFCRIILCSYAIFADARSLSVVPSSEFNLRSEHSQNITICDIVEVTNITEILSEWRCHSISKSPVTNICYWRGIHCSDSIVDYINIIDYNISGIIPDSIGYLSTLTSLELQGNNLNSTIPSVIGYLHLLERLDFSSNILTGTIPTSIGALNSISFFGIDRNSLTGSIPSTICNIKSLRIFYLFDNSLSHSIPNQIGELTNLEIFQAHYNKLSSTIPSTIGYLSASFSNLNLANNIFASTIPSSICNLNLKLLFLSNNNLFGTIPSCLGDLIQLGQLELQNNSLSGRIPDALSSLTLLKKLHLQNNQLTSSIPTAIGYHLVQLQDLVLYGNHITSSIPTSLCLLSSLHYLLLSSNSIQSSMPTCIGKLSTLLYLDLSHNLMTYTIPPSIGKLKNLQVLELNSNSLNGSIPLSITNLNSSLYINLANNRLSGSPPGSICQIRSLRYLLLADNMYTCLLDCQDDGPRHSNPPMPRCSHSQDTAMYHLSTALRISSAMKSVLTWDTFTTEVTVGSGIDPVAISYSFGTATQYELSFRDQGEFILNDDFHIAICADALCRIVLYNISVAGIPTFQATIRNRPTFFVVSVQSGGHRDYMAPTALQLDVTVYYKPHGWSFVNAQNRVMLSSSMDLYSENITAVDLCQRPWFGVTCAMGEVVALDLSSRGLVGTLPTALGLLTGLTALILSSNSINGSIPTSLGNLKSLVKLELKYNKLIGPIPIQFSHLSQLAYVDLRYNKFSGTVPSFFTPMTNLVALYADSNQFSGTLPSSLCEAIKDRERGLTFSITANPKLSCYQDKCWDTSSLNRTLSNCFISSSKSSSTKSSSSSSTLTTPLLYLAGPITFLVFIVLVGYFLYKFYKQVVQRRREERLMQLPVHRALLGMNPVIRHNFRNRISPNDQQHILEIVRSNQHTVNALDYDGDTALSIILTGKCTISATADVVAALIESSLPFNPLTMEAIPPRKHLYVWTDLVQRKEPLVVSAVGIVLSKYRNLAVELSNSEDAQGRRCVDIASPACKEKMLRVMNLHERYELKPGPPEHRSATSLVVFALDHNKLSRGRQEDHLDGDDENEQGNMLPPKKVALKFMENRDQYLREVETRRRCEFDDRYVLPTLRSYDGDAEDAENMAFRSDAIAKGYLIYPYCVVMEAGTMSLKQVVDKQHVAGEDWDTIRAMAKQITHALRHIHERGIIHSDVKALNILEVGHTLKLIDLDACVSFKDKAYDGMKYSSACLPPEMFALTPSGKVVVRAAEKWTPNAGYDLLPASPAHDMWSLGCVLYLLCTGATLFLSTVSDNLSRENFFSEVFNCTEDSKQEKLSIVTNHLARNLLSLLLNKDPKARLDADHVLSHPFLTGGSFSRLQGEEPEWDIFLSYRVYSDLRHATVLYEALTQRGLHVWWDRKCLRPGQNWEEGFCSGLVSSRYLVCLMSRGAIKHPTLDSRNFETLGVESRCDNVLLEWRLALELKERGMIEGVFPVMIGDLGPDGEYSDYFKSGCNPTAPDIVVESVEAKLKEHLNREGLGRPYSISG